MFRPEDVDAFNSEVAAWTKETKSAVKDEMQALGIKSSNGGKALRTAIRKNAGVSNRISFKIPRHYVFVHKGVGRGTKITDVGSTKRKAKPFLNPVLDKNIGKLGDIVADHQGTMVVNALMIK